MLCWVTLLKVSVSVTYTSVISQIVTTLYTFTSLNRCDIMHPQHFPYYTFRETLFFIQIFNHELDQNSPCFKAAQLKQRASISHSIQYSKFNLVLISARVISLSFCCYCFCVGVPLKVWPLRKNKNLLDESLRTSFLRIHRLLWL